MEMILTVPFDRPRHHPLRLVVMMGLTALLVLTISSRFGPGL
jgi:hypothetical protein